MSDSVNVVELSAEQTMLGLYADSVSLVSELDPAVVQGNIDLIGNMPFRDDLVVPIEAATFIADNAGFLVCMLGMNYENIRHLFLSILDEEIGVDSMSVSERADFRRKTGEGFAKDSDVFIILGATNFSSSILSEFCFACEKSFSVIGSCDAATQDVDSYLATCTDEDKEFATMIFSNFVYLLRIFSHNTEFIVQLMKHIDSFKKFYGIE